MKKEISQQIERLSWEMRQTKFWTFERITEELAKQGYDVDLTTVYRAVQRVNKRLAEDFRKRAEEIKGEQTAQLEHVATEAMRVWQESEGEIVVRRESVKREVHYGKDKAPVLLKDAEGNTVRGADGQPVSELITVEMNENTEYRQQFGDPRYLAEARAAKADIRKIWGLDAVKEDGPAVVIQKAYVNVPIDDV